MPNLTPPNSSPCINGRASVPPLEMHPPRSSPRIVVAIGFAHVYLTRSAIETLFCDHYRLHTTHPLSQPTQFATLESVSLIGRLGWVHHIPVIGPARSANQIEISPAQARMLGVDALARDSGDLDGTHGILIEGPRARLQVDSGVICVQPHLHLDPIAAKHLMLSDRSRVDICKKSSGSFLIFHDVLVRVAPGYAAEFHVNADQAKTAGLKGGDAVMVSAAPAL